ncbi:hypothetical protein BH10PSE11_BH10PSE11_39540 [soil metagenome]
MTVKSPRVFIADFDLVGYHGHFFNQVFGLREAAKERGLATRIYICRKALPKIAEELDAQAILPPIQWLTGDYDSALESFADTQHGLIPFWSDLEASQISMQDLLVVTSSRPQVIYAVGQWLGSRAASARPAVTFRFFGPDFYDFETKAFKEAAWAYRFASRIFLRAPGAERVFFSLNDQAALVHLERLSLRKAFYLPVPKYYGAVTGRSAARTGQPLKIYIYANGRSGLIADRITDLINSILSRYPDVKFLVRFTKNAPGEDDVRAKVDASGIGQSVEIIPADQSHVDYLATIERSDVILLPHSPVIYRGIVSGVFCEIAAMGKIAVIPAGTWMADHVASGHAAGVLFEDNSLTEMVNAVERVIRDRTHLQNLADRCARPFREENSCAKNLEGMIELAGQAHDMRLSCVPLTDTTKALGSQHYFGEGWHFVDPGFGIWSDGDRAEFNFSIVPNANALFFSAQVRPFLARGHSRLDISLIANKEPVAEWSFDAARPEDLDWSWRHVKIPEPIAASGEIQMVLMIHSPASPKDLGLSSDPRKLGIALRRIALGPDARDLDSSEPAPKRSRLKRWLKRFR